MIVNKTVFLIRQELSTILYKQITCFEMALIFIYMISMLINCIKGILKSCFYSECEISMEAIATLPYIEKRQYLSSLKRRKYPVFQEKRDSICFKFIHKLLIERKNPITHLDGGLIVIIIFYLGMQFILLGCKFRKNYIHFSLVFEFSFAISLFYS